MQTAVQNSLAIAGARTVAVSFTQPKSNNCEATAATIARPIEGSGRYAVKLEGNGCSAWAWLQLDVWAQRAGHHPPGARGRAAGIGGDDGGTADHRRARPGAAVADTAAARSIPRGQMVLASHVRAVGGGAGEAVKVLVRSGAIVIESTGRLVSCGRDRACAVLPSGKHVEGRLDEGRLLVDLP